MKKQVFALALSGLVLFTTGCGGSGSSFEADVKKKADYMCQIQKLQAAGKTEEAEKITKEMDAFDEKMEKKYKDKEPSEAEQKKGREIVESVMKDCK